MKTNFFALLLCIILILTGCGKSKMRGQSSQGPVADLGSDDASFGSSLNELGAYDGYFEDDIGNVTIKCVSGTPSAYKIEGSTICFSTVNQDTVYSISGSFKGNIIIDVGEGYDFTMELHGLSLISTSENPIMIISGDNIAIEAKKDTKNYIYDMRSAIDDSDESLYSGAIHAETDLEISGKGELVVLSENNKGIHTKKDMKVKDLTLLVSCVDNALKGNDSVSIDNGRTILIASGGDSIKTSNSNISEKGNQRGNVSISGGTHNLYAARDGIDAAHDVIIDGQSTLLNIYTDKYSNYSHEVTSSSTNENYIRFTSDAYYYSVKYYNSDSDYIWTSVDYHSTISSGGMNYYYYSYPKMPNYAKIQFFIYEDPSQCGQETEYLVKSDYLTQNTSYDTFALTASMNGLYYEWTNYTTNIQSNGFGGGPGGMGGGNSEKNSYSSKGIKSANEITIINGTVNIKSYDDAIHANNGKTLESGSSPLGNVTIRNGTITVYSNDDGLHADGALSIQGGTLSVVHSYEGIEGNTLNISGGYISVIARDDGLNATSTSGSAIIISGGTLYIYCTGDGIDSNSRTSYQGIVFSGGRTVIISNSNGNCAIDSDSGYSYTGGEVVAITPRGGMSGEATKCQSFSSIGHSSQISLQEGSYLNVEINKTSATIRIPVSINALVIVLGDNSPSIGTKSTSSKSFDTNGVCWE